MNSDTIKQPSPEPEENKFKATESKNSSVNSGSINQTANYHLTQDPGNSVISTSSLPITYLYFSGNY